MGIQQINTLDELVEQAVIMTDTRYQLNERTDLEYDDLAAGKAWHDNREAAIGKCPGYRQEGYEEWSARDDEYDKLQPSQHPVKSWSLREGYDTQYQLSNEIGEALDNVWTKRTKYHTPERVGTMTLAGMLKRLGRTDVAEKIRESERQRKERDAKYRRNNTRSMFTRKLKELETMVADYGAEIGVTAEMFQLPPELADKLVEEP